MSIAGSAIVSGLTGAFGANSAGDTQGDALRYAADKQEQMFNTQRSDLAPWRQAGSTALNEISGGLGLPGGTNYSTTPGQFAHQFNAGDLNANMSPGYQFALDQGNLATRNQANLSGGQFSGNTLKAISDYNVGAAQQGYQQAFNNYTTNQNNIYNRLQTIAGLGATSASNSATGGSTYAANIGANLGAEGAARAGGTVGMANNIGSAINNAGSWYGINRMINPGESEPVRLA